MTALIDWMVKDLMADPVFYMAGGVAVLAGVGVVTRRNPVYCAIFMLVAFLSLAVLYLLLSASFLAAMHVLVYTGAILVLFLFVIMLLNLKPEELGQEYPLPARGAVALLCAVLFGVMAAPALLDPALRTAGKAPTADFGSIVAVGRSLFGPYALPFELASALILVAIFSGVVLTKKKI
ncbi:MAG TPA: NADH-quinone oxidoreductase subunit J [Planctomycetota bacterium]